MVNLKRTYIYTLTLFIVSINLRIGITSISPLLETIRQDLNLINFTVSFLTSIPVLCMGIFALFTGQVNKRWGTEKAIAGPLLSGFIKDKFPTKIGLMIGVYSVGMGTGASLSAGFTIPLQHILKGSWNMALAFWSVFTIVALIFWYPIMKQNKSIKTHNKRNNVLQLKNKKTWLFTIFFGLQSGIFYSVTTWMAPTFQSMGVSSQQAGTLITVFTFVQMVCSFVIPTSADYYKNRTLWLLGSIFFVLIGLFFIIYSLTTPWISAVLVGIGLGGLFPLALMLPLDETKTSEDASAWTAMMQSGGYIMGGLIPILTGITRDISHDDHKVFLMMAFLSVILLILTLIMRQRKIETNVKVF
ncbi:CynX/NimT family MFS transporter [Bacillus sp. PSXD-155]|uniref:MFS transporter n=1 Tax=Bacillus sp. PSXD-155 TaxID=3404821 RepID=UPI003BB5E635